MKSLKRILASAALVLAFAASSNAQNTATVTATASATIVAPITIVNTTPMNFGSIIASVAGGTVKLDSVGNARTASGVTLTTLGTATPASGVFTVTGTTGYTFNVTLPGSASTLTNPSSNTMSLGTFRTNATNANLLASGSYVFGVGATLVVGANQAPGVYSGTYNVTVTYN